MSEYACTKPTEKDVLSAQLLVHTGSSQFLDSSLVVRLSYLKRPPSCSCRVFQTGSRVPARCNACLNEAAASLPKQKLYLSLAPCSGFAFPLRGSPWRSRLFGAFQTPSGHFTGGGFCCFVFFFSFFRTKCFGFLLSRGHQMHECVTIRRMYNERCTRSQHTQLLNRCCRGCSYNFSSLHTNSFQISADEETIPL